MYIHISLIYIYTYINTYICLVPGRESLLTQECIYMYKYIYINLYVYIHTYIHIYTCVVPG